MQIHKSVIKKLPLWKSSRISIRELRGGITNFNYLVTYQKKKYVAHFNPNDSSVLLGINRRAVVHNTKIAATANLGPEVVKYYAKPNLLILKFIPGQMFSPKLAKLPSVIKRLARLLKKLHYLKGFQGRFDPFKTGLEYISTCKKKKFWLPGDLRPLLKKLAIIKRRLGRYSTNYSCHLDLVLQNILKTKKGIRLLDWEYSANSDFRFDLAMLSVRGNYSDKEDKMLLKFYGNINKRLLKQMQLMKAVVHFREAAWGLIQHSVSKIDYDYKKYAKSNFSSFRKIWAVTKNK